MKNLVVILSAALCFTVHADPNNPNVCEMSQQGDLWSVNLHDGNPMPPVFATANEAITVYNQAVLSGVCVPAAALPECRIVASSHSFYVIQAGQESGAPIASLKKANALYQTLLMAHVCVPMTSKSNCETRALQSFFVVLQDGQETGFGFPTQNEASKFLNLLTSSTVCELATK